jgi:hypothetical protein
VIFSTLFGAVFVRAISGLRLEGRADFERDESPIMTFSMARHGWPGAAFSGMPKRQPLFPLNETDEKKGQASEAETDTTRNAVCVVIAPAQLSLIADECRKSRRPPSRGAHIDNKTIMTFVRSEGRRRNSRKGDSAEGYRQSRVQIFVLPGRPYRWDHQDFAKLPGIRSLVSLDPFSKIPLNRCEYSAAKRNPSRSIRQRVRWWLKAQSAV